MEYTVVLSDSADYVIIRVIAPVTRDLAMRFVKDAKALAELGPKRIDKFLFDMTGTRNVAGAGENYDFAYSDMSRLEANRGARSALLIADGDSTHDFSALVLRNAGYNVGVFTNEDEAIAWLFPPDNRANQKPETS